MILKMRSHTEDGCDRWTLYDNIENAHWYFNKDIQEKCIRLKYRGTEEQSEFVILDEAYLMSDVGKTIERLRPAVKNAWVNKPLKQLEPLGDGDV